MAILAGYRASNRNCGWTDRLISLSTLMIMFGPATLKGTLWACSSAVEHGAHNLLVAGSNPAGPTLWDPQTACFRRSDRGRRL